MTTPPDNPLNRRGFFGDALREALDPISKILDRKVNPILRTINELPAEMERAANAAAAPKDQPHVSDDSRSLSLPVLGDRILRPPGALPPGEFENVCSRCGTCVESCPSAAILLDPNGLVADGFPYIVPSGRPCVMCDELACMTKCPSGALKLVDKLRIRIGVAKVDHAACLRSHGEDCRLCAEACPIADRAIYISPDTNKVRVKKSGCTGCGICENICPTDPRAITIRALADPDKPHVVIA